MSRRSLPILVLILAIAATAQASDPYRLYRFCAGTTCTDGALPAATVTMGPDGALYGTTEYGGVNGNGVVFRLDSSGEQVIHEFGEFPGDGVAPEAALVFDRNGNIYGTTKNGGNAACYLGCGTVFELTPAGNNEWTEQVLYSFCSMANCLDGMSPMSSLTFDAEGNLYGTTTAGGPQTPKQCKTFGCGTVFELVKGLNNSWSEKVLFQFDFVTGDDPQGSLVFDAAGNLYGASGGGGTGGGFGVVFQLSPTDSGFWNEKNILNFNVANGRAPFEGLIIDKKGNLYGTTYFGGDSSYCNSQSPFGCGEVFELSPAQNGTWKESILYSFCVSGTCPDGSDPWSGLVMDASGALYGTTYGGGQFLGGTVFKLTPSANLPWTETVLHSFGAAPNDGSLPEGGVIFNSTYTALYGTTSEGGNLPNCVYGCGAVFGLFK